MRPPPAAQDEALLAALEDGTVRGAALDVHWDEPFVLHRSEPLGTRGAKFVESGALICTPHNAWYSVQSRLEMRHLGAATALKALRGEPVRNCVNAAHLGGRREHL